MVAFLVGVPINMKRIAAVAALAVSTLVQGQNLVNNGGFESVTGGSSGHIGVNGIGLSGWTATRLSGSVNSGSTSFALVGTAAQFSENGSGVYSVYGSPGGPNLNLWGTIPDASRGNILVVEADQSWVATQVSTTVNGLTPNGNYTLTFDWAAAQQKGFYGDTSSGWQGSIGATPFDTTTIAIQSQGFSGWQTQTISFAAGPTGSEVLSFIAYGTGGGLPPMALLDNVQVNPVVVPEPGEYAGAFAGLLVVAGIARKIRANQAK